MSDSSKIAKDQSIRVVETFLSLQGEGLRSGVPSIFIRVFGCNASCPGFGQPRGNLIPIEDMPHNKFDIDGIKSIEDLPVFDVGCDSSAAWSKRYRHLTTLFTDQQLFDQVETLLSDAQIVSTAPKPDIVITGGEPLLRKYQKFWPHFLAIAEQSGYKNVTFETNGTQQTIPKFVKDLPETINYLFSVSPKLEISGEARDKMFRPDAVKSYTVIGDVVLKYVVREEIDVEQAMEWTKLYNIESKSIVYLMPEGATIEGLELTEREVADLAVKYGVRFTSRLHCHLYGNQWGT